MRVERVTQFSASGSRTLDKGFSLHYVEHENAKYFEVNTKKIHNSGGWTKERWLNLVSDFRLEFKYE